MLVRMRPQGSGLGRRFTAGVHYWAHVAFVSYACPSRT